PRSWAGPGAPRGGGRGAASGNGQLAASRVANWLSAGTGRAQRSDSRRASGASYICTIGGVPWSYYKGEPLGKKPPCAICAGPGRGERAELELGHGISVWLCAAHRAPDFLTARSGRDLVVSLIAVWEASGCLTQRRHRALDAHLAAIRRKATARARPGSYAWPELRRAVERRAGAGGPPHTGCAPGAPPPSPPRRRGP